MSDTPCDRPRAPSLPWGQWIEWVLAAFSLAMLAAMWRFIGQTTIPYHVLFLAIGLVYGFRVWPLGRTVVVMVFITLATGTVFLRAYRAELIEIDELTEIVLMPMLLISMIWHARRRDEAMRRAQDVAAVNAELLQRQHEGLRDTSHAIRTPTTIARGFVEMAAAATDDPDVLEPLAVVARHLDRTGLLSERLLSLAALDAQGVSRVDMLRVSTIVERLGAEWSSHGDRVWQVEPGMNAWILGDESAIEGAIEALLENSLHHTGSGDTIRMTCRLDGADVVVEVADSGPGVAAQDAESVFQRFWHSPAPDGSVGSGLGLAMVQAVVKAHMGSAAVGRSSLGGALFTLRIPRQGIPLPTPRTPPDGLAANSSDRPPTEASVAEATS
jgi:signal transduction histidine kinase